MFRPPWLVLFLVTSALCSAQWLNFPTPGIPRTRDGKPNLTAPTPKSVWGKPDLTGTWMHGKTTVEEVKQIFGHAFDDLIAGSIPGMEVGTQHKYGFDILLDFKPGESPLRPEAAELMRQRESAYDPTKPCSDITGIPYAGLLSEPLKIVESPRETMILYEIDNMHRQVFTDGRALPKEFEYPAFLGYSVGHWERDVFVVETAGFNDKTHLDLMGHPHSEALRLTERFHRRDFGHMDLEITFDDPKMYTKTFSIKIPYELLADQDLFEMYCSENEKDGSHLFK